MKTKIFSTIHENSTKNGKPNNQKIYPQPDFHSAWRHINNKLMSLVVYEDMKVVNIAKKIINRLNHYLLYLLISQPVKTTKDIILLNYRILSVGTSINRSFHMEGSRHISKRILNTG